MQIELDGARRVTSLVQTPSPSATASCRLTAAGWRTRRMSRAADSRSVCGRSRREAAHWQVSTPAARRPLWAPNGQELFYVSPAGALMGVGVARADVVGGHGARPCWSRKGISRFRGATAAHTTSRPTAAVSDDQETAAQSRYCVAPANLIVGPELARGTEAPGADELMPLALGTRLGPYEITGTLGAGGMGEVYRARDTQAESRRRAEGPARRLCARSRSPGPLPARSAGAGLAQPSAHRGHLRLRGQRRDARARAGAGRGRDAGRSDRARADSARRGAADRAADRRGPRSGARAGHHPSRSEARQHQDHARRRGEGAGLRPGEADGPPSPASHAAPICRSRRRSRRRR